MIHSYLESREFIVEVSGHQSTVKKIVAGVSQGSILGPFLFKIYISDLPTHPHTKVAIFADDTSVRSVNKYPRTATLNVQEHLNTLADYYDQWKIRVNAAKSESVIITRRRRFNGDAALPLTMNGLTIPDRKHAKYLGVTIQSNNLFNHHCQAVLQRANRTLKSLWKFIGPRSFLHTQNKINVYRIYLRPIVTYNIHAWGDQVSNTTFNQLQTFQNKCLRLALNLRPHPVTHRQIRTSTVHTMANVPPLDEFMQSLRSKFDIKAATHSNPLIVEIVNS